MEIEAPPPLRQILVTLHGGCFVGGNATWDKKQTAGLLKCGFDVRQLDFPRNTLSETLAWIREAVREFPRPRVVLGRSSGGFLAKVLLDDGTFDFALYLAPVFSPRARGALLPELGAKAAPFFRGEKIVPPRNKWNSKKEKLFLALADENVPDALFTPAQLAEAVRPGPRTHAGLISCTSAPFLEYIADWVRIVCAQTGMEEDV